MTTEDTMPETPSQAGTSAAPRWRPYADTALDFGRRALMPAVFLIAGGVIALVGERLLGFGGPPGDEMRVLTFQDWRLVCPPRNQPDARCELSQQVARDQGGTLVALSIDDSTLGSRLRVTVPHGVLLDPGLGFSAGTQAMQVHPYETCTPIGCLAQVTVDMPMLDLLRANTDGQVVVVPGNGAPVTIPFSLRGFAEGYAALARKQGLRSGWGFL